MALINAPHGVYNLQLKSRCNMASVYNEYVDFPNLNQTLCINSLFCNLAIYKYATILHENFSIRYVTYNVFGVDEEKVS